MAYLGKQPAVQGKDAGPAQRLDNVSSSFNGTLTAFDMTLDGTTVTPHINNLAIYLNGVYQEPDNAYILSGSQMKFSEAPTSGMSFQGSILGDRRLMTPDNDTLKAAMVSSDLRTAISGSFTTVSSSLASRITSEEGEAEGTVISSSAQVIANLPTGVISGSGNLSASLPPGTMSGSAQTAINLPTGTVSASMGISGSSTSTGSFGRVEVAGDLSVTGTGPGITVADTWRLYTDVSAAAPITTNWEQVDNPAGFGILGSGMTQSSGVFTFPTTGYWLINFTAAFSVAETVAEQLGQIYTTTNDNTYALASEGHSGVYRDAGSMHMGTTCDFIQDVVSTSNDKVRFHIVGAGTANGGSTYNRTFVTFIRLGDT